MDRPKLSCFTFEGFNNKIHPFHTDVSFVWSRPYMCLLMTIHLFGHDHTYVWSWPNVWK